MRENEELLSFGGHLEVLRQMLFRLLGVTFVFSCIIFCFKVQTFDILLAPSDSSFVTYRWAENLIRYFENEFRFEPFSIELIATDLSSQFVTHLTTSMYLGLLCASPLVMYELFRFIAPALLENERKYSTNIYVVDRKQEKIFRFNNSGRFLNIVGNMGNGPGEFISIKSCFLGGDTIFVSDLGTRRILSYTSEGNFINVIPFSFSLVYDNIAYLPSGGFLCHRIETSKNNRGIWIMNEKGEKAQVLYANKEIYPYCNSDWNTLSVMEDGSIGIYEPPTGSYYSFDVHKYTLSKVFQQRSTMKMLGDYKGIDQIFNVKEEYDYSIITLNTNNYIFSLWALSNHTGVFSLYLKKTKEISVFKKPLIDFPGYISLGTPMSSNLPNTLVTIFTDEYQFDDCPTQYKNMDFNEQVMIVNKWVFK